MTKTQASSNSPNVKKTCPQTCSDCPLRIVGRKFRISSFEEWSSSIGMVTFGEAQKAYAKSGQYHNIVESRGS